MLLSKFICFNGCLWIKELQFQATNVKWSQQTFQMYIPPRLYAAGPRSRVHCQRMQEKAGLYRIDDVGDIPLGFISLFHFIRFYRWISQLFNWETMIQHCKKLFHRYVISNGFSKAVHTNALLMGPHAEESICIHCLLFFLINYTTEAERNVCKYAALINLLEREHTWTLWRFQLHSGINRSQQRKCVIIFSFAVWSLQNLPQCLKKLLSFLGKQDRKLHIKYIINLFKYPNTTIFMHNRSFNVLIIFFLLIIE